MSNTVWFTDPSLLITNNSIYKIIPDSNMNNAEKINSLSRLIILITLIFFVLSRKLTILLSGLIALGLIYIIYNSDSKTYFREFFGENMNTSEITEENPLNNCLPGDDPKEKLKAPMAYTVENEEKINNSVKKMIQKNNPTFKNINDKLFKDLGENFEFNRSMIPFNSNPSTTIPNDQASFANFCYGDMLSAKEGDKFKLLSKTNQLHYYTL